MTIKVSSINSIDDPQITLFLNMKSSKLLREDLIIIESYKIISKAIKNNIKIKKLLTSSSLYENFKADFSEYLLLNSIDVYLLTEKNIKSIVGQSYHGGIMAICKRPKSVFNFTGKEPILTLNGLTSPENVGAIIRAASGFNIFNILIDTKTCHPLIKRAIRVSMGNVFFCNINQTDNLEHSLNNLKSEGYEVISFDNQESAKPIRSFQFTKKTCLIVGSEGNGIENHIKNLSTNILKIEMNNMVMHLNAASACSIFLYEFHNQIFSNNVSP